MIKEKTRGKCSFLDCPFWLMAQTELNQELYFGHRRENSACVAKLLLFLLEKAGFTEAVEKAVDALMRNLDSNMMKVSCLALMYLVS